MSNAKFVWITDGKGWTRSRTNLEDAYDEVENSYTLKNLENNILERI